MDKNMEDLIKTPFSLEKCFEELRHNKNHHLGLGDIRLTISQQEDIVNILKKKTEVSFGKKLLD
jgi:hypothetical protein